MPVRNPAHDEAFILFSVTVAYVALNNVTSPCAVVLLILRIFVVAHLKKCPVLKNSFSYFED